MTAPPGSEPVHQPEFGSVKSSANTSTPLIALNGDDAVTPSDDVLGLGCDWFGWVA